MFNLVKLIHPTEEYSIPSTLNPERMPYTMQRKATNMLTTLRSDMSGSTKFVNPYRMRRKANDRRMQRLKNVKIKKKYLVNY